MDVLFIAGPEGGVEDDEVGEVLVHAAEAVGEPGAHGGFAGDFGAGAEEGFAGVVVDGGGGGGFNEGEVVGNGAEVGEDFGEVHAALAMWVEFEHGGGDEFVFALGHSGDALALGDGVGEGFFEAFVEVGFVVEEVELGGGAGHEEEDDAFGFGFWGGPGGGGLGGEVAEDGGAEAHGGGVEELAAGLLVEHRKWRFEEGFEPRRSKDAKFFKAWLGGFGCEAGRNVHAPYCLFLKVSWLRRVWTIMVQAKWSSWSSRKVVRASLRRLRVC